MDISALGGPESQAGECMETVDRESDWPLPTGSLLIFRSGECKATDQSDRAVSHHPFNQIAAKTLAGISNAERQLNLTQPHKKKG